MKKEGIAIYTLFTLLIVSFATMNIMSHFVKPLPSKLNMGVLFTIFGLLLIVGMYSNYKNYGYIHFVAGQTKAGTIKDHANRHDKIGKKIKGKKLRDMLIIIMKN